MGDLTREHPKCMTEIGDGETIVSRQLKMLNEAGIQPDDALTVKTENGRIILYRAIKHKTLEERAAEYGGNLNLDGELDWRGDPVGNEVW